MSLTTLTLASLHFYAVFIKFLAFRVMVKMTVHSGQVLVLPSTDCFFPTEEQKLVTASTPQPL